jgi:hypothetical protein
LWREAQLVDPDENHLISIMLARIEKIGREGKNIKFPMGVIFV